MKKHSAADCEYFTLRGACGRALLPRNQSLVVSPVDDLAALVDWSEQLIIAICTLFEEEQAIVLPLLRSWPQPLSSTHLLAMINHQSKEDKVLPTLEEIKTAGEQNELLAPLYTRLPDCLERLGQFGLTISVDTNGCWLLSNIDTGLC